MTSQQELPSIFLQFCQRYNINPNVYFTGKTIPRFLRLKPQHDDQEMITKELHQYFGDKLMKISWLPDDFYAIPQDEKLQACPLYKDGKLYGQDVSSALAVLALNVQNGENILDLCCAPGGKLCYIADLITKKIGNAMPTFKLTGVDIDPHRITIVRTMLQKYKIQNTRLILADGTKFRITSTCKPRRLKKQIKKVLKAMRENKLKTKTFQFPSYVGDSGILVFETKGIFLDEYIESQKKKGKKDETNVSTKSIKLNDGSKKIIHQAEDEVELYDKILVDAECSTDGSVKHVLKILQNEELSEFCSDERISKIVNLQKLLIENAFKLLKKNGVLVYSTCSFIKEENEDVVTWLCNKYENAKVVPFFEKEMKIPYKEGYLKNTIRLDPIVSNTSGLFIAKIVKT